jgi:uncharacterized SAM-binding protein YcdF (DUF218 family)
MSARRRVIAVLGYSDRESAHELHPVCLARLGRAAELSTSEDVVVLSGWARDDVHRSEAELMAAAWSGTAAEVVVDPVARTTVENAHNALNDVFRVGASEIVVVTSSWHAPRAWTAFRWFVRFTGIRVRTASPPGRSLPGTLRELPLWLLLPFQLGLAARRSWKI